MMTYFAFPLILLAAGAGGWTEPLSPPADCRDQLTQAYRTLATAVAPNQPQVLHLHFTTETTARLPGQTSERHMKGQGDIYVRGRQLYYETPEVMMWQDGRVISTVLKAQRTVMLTLVPSRAAKGSIQPMMLLQDSLLHRATVQACRLETVKGKTQQHVRLGLSAEVTARFGLQTLDFRLEGQPAQIRQLDATYVPGRMARHITLSFAAQQWLPTASVLTNDAVRQVLDAKGQLLPAFRFYKLIDQNHIGSTKH